MSYLGEIWKSFRSTVRGFDSPHQLALGFALGIWLGLIPKDSALPYLIGVLAILTPGNLLCLLAGALLASFASPLLDSLTHYLGHAALTYAPLEPTWVYLLQLPIVPWTRLENTVVMGNLLLGAILLIPTYSVFFYVAKVYGPKIYAALRRKSSDESWSESEPPVPIPQEG